MNYQLTHSTTGNWKKRAYFQKISITRRSLSPNTRSAPFGPARTDVLSPFGYAQSLPWGTRRDKLRRRIIRGMDAIKLLKTAFAQKNIEKLKKLRQFWGVYGTNIVRKQRFRSGWSASGNMWPDYTVVNNAVWRTPLEQAYASNIRRDFEFCRK